MNILGISCHYHDSAACLVQDGKIISAAEEERFNRIKHSSIFPIESINFCLQRANISVYDIDYVVFYEKPYLKFQRVVISHIKSWPFSMKNFLETMPNWLDDRLILPVLLKNEIGYEGKTLFIKHHLSHAASTFYASKFQKAAILTSDGVGEFSTMTLGIGDNNKIKILKELQYPNSLGLLYSAITSYLGFRANNGEGKVMALSDYGSPKYLQKFKKIIKVKQDGSFSINRRYFNFNSGRRMFTRKFESDFGKSRKNNEELQQEHYDMAATLQQITEDILIKSTNHLHKITKLDNLCCAGGTFLNCVANTKILSNTPFKKLFIQPAAGDSGAALGAALFVNNHILNNKIRYPMENTYIGPDFEDYKIERYLKNQGITYKKMTDSELTKSIAKKIAEDQIVGWFQGRMEFGPRALGNRSILANPNNSDMKKLLNNKVKNREFFRPYGVSILEEESKKWFDMDCESPFMLLIEKIKPNKKNLIKSALHVNNTSRLHTVNKKENPLYYDLIKQFFKFTNIPMVINTSFNNQEPIVCSYKDAYNCFIKTKMDCLVLGNYIIEK